MNVCVQERVRDSDKEVTLAEWHRHTDIKGGKLNGWRVWGGVAWGWLRWFGEQRHREGVNKYISASVYYVLLYSSSSAGGGSRFLPSSRSLRRRRFRRQRPFKTDVRPKERRCKSTTTTSTSPATLRGTNPAQPAALDLLITFSPSNCWTEAVC